MSCHWSHITKKGCLDWGSNSRPGNVELPWSGFEPQTWKRGIWGGTGTATPCCGRKEGKRPSIAYCFTQCSNGSSLGSFLFPRQDNLVQRCTSDECDCSPCMRTMSFRSLYLSPSNSRNRSLSCASIFYPKTITAKKSPMEKIGRERW